MKTSASIFTVLCLTMLALCVCGRGRNRSQSPRLRRTSESRNGQFVSNDGDNSGSAVSTRRSQWTSPGILVGYSPWRGTWVPRQPGGNRRGERDGVCGLRPYDNIDRTPVRRSRRSPIVDNRQFSSRDVPFGPKIVADYHVQKIVGGQYAVHGAVPWQGRLEISLTHEVYLCGAIIISEYWLLAATHCFEEVTPTSILSMYVGDYHVRSRDEGEQKFEVEEIILHRDYNKITHDYDIALIKIAPVNGHGIVFNDYVQPACLPDSNTPTPKEGLECIISGWGRPRKAAVSHEYTLKMARVPLVSHQVCKYLYSMRGYYITNQMRCAGNIEGGVGPCLGDSGGPLVCNLNGVYTLVGITSWGVGCAAPNAPGVYADVAVFEPWIQRAIKQYSETPAEVKLPPKPGA